VRRINRLTLPAAVAKAGTRNYCFKHVPDVFIIITSIVFLEEILEQEK
jgi:hypothetical protein